MNTKGQLRTREIVNQSKLDITSAVLGSDSVVFIYKKSERISMAVHLLSGLFPAEEPLKWRMREVSLKILSELLSVTKLNDGAASFSCRALSGKIFELSSCLDIAFRSGLISEMNYSVLSKEVELLLQSVEARIGRKNDDGNNINREFFAVDERYFLREEKDYSKKQKRDPTEAPGALSNKDMSEEVLDIGHVNNSSPIDKHNVEVISDKIDTATAHSFNPPVESRQRERVASNSERSDRRALIIGVLKKRDYVSVGDLTSIMPNYSEKTVQRELISMVSDNVLKRTGSKRWTRYFLADRTKI